MKSRNSKYQIKKLTLVARSLAFLALLVLIFFLKGHFDRKDSGIINLFNLERLQSMKAENLNEKSLEFAPVKMKAPAVPDPAPESGRDLERQNSKKNLKEKSSAENRRTLQKLNAMKNAIEPLEQKRQFQMSGLDTAENLEASLKIVGARYEGRIDEQVIENKVQGLYMLGLTQKLENEDCLGLVEKNILHYQADASTLHRSLYLLDILNLAKTCVQKDREQFHRFALRYRSEKIYQQLMMADSE